MMKTDARGAERSERAATYLSSGVPPTSVSRMGVS